MFNNFSLEKRFIVKSDKGKVTLKIDCYWTINQFQTFLFIINFHLQNRILFNIFCYSSGLGLEIMLTPGQNGSEREKETE
jgi:hypothetical protein